MSKWQKMGIFAFVVVSLTLILFIGLVAVISQLHPYDCTQAGYECGPWLPKILFWLGVFSLWAFTGWLAVRDWSKK